MEGGGEGKKHQCVVASHAPPTGDLAHNPGMCPDWESNRQPFGSQASTESTEAHQPGVIPHYFLHFSWHLVHRKELSSKTNVHLAIRKSYMENLDFHPVSKSVFLSLIWPTSRLTRVLEVHCRKERRLC